MRFCPFCSAENADDLAVCSACGRRLPPLPPRRARNAPPTGVQLPPRPGTASQPPATAQQLGLGAPPSSDSAAPTPASGPVSAPTSVPVATSSAPGSRPTAGLSPTAFSSRSGPIPSVADRAKRESGGHVAHDHERRSILSAISPGPAAHRREAPVDDRRDGDPSRRASDRGKPASIPPAIPPARSKPTTLQPLAEIRPPAPAGSAFDDDFHTVPSASAFAEPPAPTAAPKPPTLPSTGGPLHIAASRAPSSASDPPPTRIQRPEALADRPFTPPQVSPVPEVPEPGLVNAARYALRFVRARFQRRGAIKILGAEIKQDTEALDQVLGALGREARNAKVEGRVFSAENAAITAAEERVMALAKEQDEVEQRRADENSRFVEIERERNAKLAEAEGLVDEAQKDLSHLEGQRRGYRDKRKELERRQKAYLKAAEDSEKSAGASQMGETRAELRRAAELHRKEAALLEPERQDIDRRIASLERPIGEATAKLDAAKAELDAAKRSLADAREGHTHRLAELDAEQKRKAREIANADAEIAQRLVTLGTLVNLNRIEDEKFAELYQRIDRLRGAITARTTEIEKLTAEREAYDKGTLTRGIAAIGGAVVLFIALVVVIAALV